MKAHLLTAATIVSSAIALSACQGGADRAPANRSTAATPKVSVTRPAPSPSPRSIMQPQIEVPTIEPAPLAPLDVTIGFSNGRVALDAGAREALDQLVASPQARSGGAIILRGNTDSHGDDRDNRIVSKHRADAVENYLSKQGIDPSRMTVIALGEDRPIAPNANPDGSDDPEGRARNRRVDITVTPGDSSVAAPASAAAPSNGSSDATEEN